MHEISVRQDGQAEAMYAIKPAWHDLGTVIDHAPNAEEAFKVAGLNWDVLTKPVFYEGIGDNGQPSYNRIKDRMATIRADTGACLGVVSDHYKVVQNYEAFQWVDKLIGTGDVRYESAGALKGGKLIWLLARLPGFNDQIVDGDTLERYLLLFNSHDGSNAVTIMPTSVRVVCWNTLNLAAPVKGVVEDEAALSAINNRKFRSALHIRHSAQVHFKMDDARKVLGIANQAFDAFADDARKLAKIHITQAQFDAFIERLIPTPGTGKLTGSRIRSRQAITDHYLLSKEQEMVRGTAWAALNAVTHFVDHDWKGKAKDPDQRKANTLYSQWFGQAGGFKEEARSAAFEMFASA